MVEERQSISGETILIALDKSAHKMPHQPRIGAPKSGYAFLAAGISCAVLVWLSALWLDRPIADWVHGHLGDTRYALFEAAYENVIIPIGPFALMAGPAQILGPLALTSFFGIGMAIAAGWRPQMLGRVFVSLCVSTLIAIELNREVKPIFGRTWPESWQGNNPSWIRDGVFGFFPFHGGKGWNSFPSGHTTVMMTPITILWLVWPRLRPLWISIVACVAMGLIGGNYHFLSDIIGGLYLGAVIGAVFAALLLSPGDHLNWTIIKVNLVEIYRRTFVR